MYIGTPRYRQLPGEASGGAEPVAPRVWERGGVNPAGGRDVRPVLTRPRVALHEEGGRREARVTAMVVTTEYGEVVRCPSSKVEGTNP